MKKKYYDLIFGLGAVCSCTQGLRTSRLQLFSYPYDWLYGASIKQRAEIFSHHFDNWLKIDDLEYIGERLKPEPCDIYRNKRTEIVYNHDFPLHTPLSQSFSQVLEKYNRRIGRLFKQINCADKVLAVYMEPPEKNQDFLSNQELIEAHNLLVCTEFRDKIDLIYLTCSNNSGIVEETINSHITRYSFNYSQPQGNGVNRKALKLFYKRFSLKINTVQKLFLLRNRVLTFITYLTCLFIPISSIRKSFRKNIYQRFR